MPGKKQKEKKQLQLTGEEDFKQFRENIFILDSATEITIEIDGQNKYIN